MASYQKIRENKDGSVSYQITAYDDTGRRHTTTCRVKAGIKQSSVQKEVQRAAVLFEQEIRSNYGINDKRLTFGQYAVDYVERGQFAYKTRQGYRTLLKKIVPALGDIPLTKLTPQHVEQFIAELQKAGANGRSVSATAAPELIGAYKEKGLTLSAAGRLCSVGESTISSALKGQAVSPRSAELIAAGLGLPLKKAFSFTGETARLSEKTVKEHYRFIVAVLNKAKRQRLIPHNVAAEYMDAPKMRRKEAEYLEAEELAAVLAALDEEPIRIKALIYTLAFTGLRRGELCGLDWQDIDLEQKTVHVCKSRQSVTGGGVQVMPTKTASSVRVITIPDLLADVLREYRAWWLAERVRLGSAWQCGDAVFISRNGTLPHPDTITKTVPRFAARHDLPHLVPHKLRHTFATIQIANGVDVRTLMGRTGHSQAATLLNVYSHMLQQKEAAAAAVFDKAFGGKKEQV